MGSEGIGDDDKDEAVDNDEVGNDDGNADDDLHGILIYVDDDDERNPCSNLPAFHLQRGKGFECWG